MNRVPFRCVMVPLDGSPLAEQVLPSALTIARRSGAKLVLVQVRQVPLAIDGLTAFYDMPPLENGETESSYLRKVVDRLPGKDEVAVETALLDGPVATVLHDHAAAVGADLVVMASHGRGPFSRFWLGSVADELVRRLPMPVLLFRPQAEEPAPLQALPLQRVLVPLDGSPLAEGVLESAIALGSLFGAAYQLLRVVPPGPEGWVKATEEAEQARHYLQGIEAKLREESLRVQASVVIDAHPAVRIVAAAEHDADVIALATHGRGGFKRLLLGSVADKVLRGVSLPVLVYRPPEG